MIAEVGGGDQNQVDKLKETTLEPREDFNPGAPQPVRSAMGGRKAEAMKLAMWMARPRRPGGDSLWLGTAAELAGRPERNATRSGTRATAGASRRFLPVMRSTIR